MIVIQTTIDGKGPYNFILDSGVGIIIITDPSLIDSVGDLSSRRIKLSGIGEGKDLEATIASNISFDIHGVVGQHLTAAILSKDQFGLSNYAGMSIHGLIGYEFFNGLAVKLNFTDSTLTVARPGDIKSFRRGYKIPITVEQNKPYMEANVVLQNNEQKKSKLLIDFGAGHPLMLENLIENNKLPYKYIAANLGVGLTGPVNGLLSRIREIDIGKYKFKDVITSFPSKDTSRQNKTGLVRDGSVGLGILKRFTLIVDYQNNAMYVKPALEFKKTFEHDMTGMEYYADGDDYHAIIVSRVEPGSAADEIGIQKDDAIIAINFKPVADMTIQDVDDIFKSYNDRSLLLDIYRDKKKFRYILTLRRRI